MGSREKGMRKALMVLTATAAFAFLAVGQALARSNIEDAQATSANPVQLELHRAEPNQTARRAAPLAAPSGAVSHAPPDAQSHGDACAPASASCRSWSRGSDGSVPIPDNALMRSRHFL